MLEAFLAGLCMHRGEDCAQGREDCACTEGRTVHAQRGGLCNVHAQRGELCIQRGGLCNVHVEGRTVHTEGSALRFRMLGVVA